MPSEVSDIKQFIEICRRKDASCEQTRCASTRLVQDCAICASKDVRLTQRLAARIKKSKKGGKAGREQQIKFKVRCKRYLYTLVLKDADKADKLKQSLPPGES